MANKSRIMAPIPSDDPSNLKYNLQKLVDLLPRTYTIDRIQEELAKEGIPARTFRRDKAIVLTEGSEIPGDRLMIYSKFFSVDISELFNYSVKTKPFQRSVDNKKSKTGLA